MRILIATSRFNDLAGSEITVLEYAQELNRQGHEVTIVSFRHTETYKQTCSDHNIFVSVIKDEKIRAVDWDIIWVFHAVTYYALFLKYYFKSKYVVFSSLSHYEPLESPPIENTNIDLFLTNSKENLNYFKKAFPNYSNKVTVLLNSIPQAFLNTAPIEVNEKKIIIVSNHVPEEIKKAQYLLQSSGWTVDIYGIDYKHKRITADILNGYQACITIGKTVCYCLGLHIPVFCYDRFGGPGWITKKNLDSAEEFNFSGRCTKEKMNAEKILSLFSANHMPDQSQCRELNLIAQKRYSLSANLSLVLKSLTSSPPHTSMSNLTVDNVLIKALEVYLRDQNIQDELKDAWQAETTKRKEVEAELLEMHQAFLQSLEDTNIKALEIYMHNQSIQDELRSAWQAETTKRKEVEAELLEMHQAFQQSLEDTNIFRNTLEKRISELENDLAIEKNKSIFFCTKEALRSVKKLLTLQLNIMITKIQSSSNKDKK